MPVPLTMGDLRSFPDLPFLDLFLEGGLKIKNPPN